MQINPKTRIVVLTGAGISSESGIKTFRDTGGLWENHRIDQVATIDAFVSNPELVWDFYKERWRNCANVMPNKGHHALVILESYSRTNFTLVSQNVDGLHQRAGSKNVLNMHGSLDSCFCTKCRVKYPMEYFIDTPGIPYCPACQGMLRPDIVWFGEIPYYLYEIENALKECDLFILVGSSGVVYPAAGFVMTAKLMGAKTVCINLEKPDNYNFFDEFYIGRSGDLLPELVNKWTN